MQHFKLSTWSIETETLQDNKIYKEGAIMSLPSGMTILFQPARALVDGLHATCKSKLIKILQRNIKLHFAEKTACI